MTIYFAKMGEWIKIGYTANEDASRRIAQLQTGQPQKIELLGTIPGGRDAEAGLHRELEPWRGNGEWFKQDEILSIVSLLIKHQHPWYFCRFKSMSNYWERSFRVIGNSDPSAYVDCQIRKEINRNGPQIAISNRIRQHRRKFGKDKIWEEKLRHSLINCKGFEAERYLAAWDDLAVAC